MPQPTEAGGRGVATDPLGSLALREQRAQMCCARGAQLWARLPAGLVPQRKPTRPDAQPADAALLSGQ
eukprot:5105050-Prymnesium_polylepis.1